MNRARIAAVTAASILVAASSAAGDSKPLTPVQVAAKAVFDEGIKESLQRVRDRCGVEVPVTTDFENYDESAWVKEYGGRGDEDVKRERARGFMAGQCASVLDAVSQYCVSSQSSGKGKGATAPPPTSPSWRGAELKSVACLFAGSSARTADDQTEDYVRRNMSFANGVFTVRQRPDFSNVTDNASSVLRGQSAASSLGSKNGASCTSNGDCRSSLCSASTCRACTTDAACGAGRYCFSDKCWKKSDGPSSSSSGKSKRHQSCRLGKSDCEAGLVCVPEKKKKPVWGRCG